jgi:hypothetical protein
LVLNEFDDFCDGNARVPPVYDPARSAIAQKASVVEADNLPIARENRGT